MSLSLSALCFFILSPSLHSFPLHCLSPPVPYPPSLLLRSSHITLPLHSPTPPHSSLSHPFASLLPHLFTPFFTLYPPPCTPHPFTSLLSHYFTPPLHFPTPSPFAPPPLHSPTPSPSPLHLTPPTSLHPMPSLSTPPHVLLDNEVTAVSTIWRAQPDSKTVSVIPDSLAM